MKLSEKSKDKWEEYVPEGGGDDGKSIVRDNFIYLPVIPFLCPPRDSFRFDVTGTESGQCQSGVQCLLYYFSSLLSGQYQKRWDAVT